MKSTPHAILSIGVLFSFLLALLAPLDAEAKRMGGGRSMGKQSSGFFQKTPARQNSSQQNASNFQQKKENANSTSANPNANPPKRNWGGLLGGLAAGLGLGYLLSQIGFPEGLASFLGNAILIGLLVLAGLWIFRKLRGNMGAGQTYREATVAAGANSAPGTFGPPQGDMPKPSILQTPSTASPVVMPEFDADAFLGWAKDAFTQLQAAWDAGDLGKIRPWVTPEMFMEIQKDLQARQGVPSKTAIVSLDAELLSVEGDEATVRFSGMLREDDNPDVFAEPFSEIWHFLKENGQWQLAGIQQDS